MYSIYWTTDSIKTFLLFFKNILLNEININNNNNAEISGNWKPYPELKIKGKYYHNLIQLSKNSLYSYV